MPTIKYAHLTAAERKELRKQKCREYYEKNKESRKAKARARYVPVPPKLKKKPGQTTYAEMQKATENARQAE